MNDATHPATTIVFHLGAPKANMDMLTSSLRKDNVLMSEHRAMARRPSQYRSGIHNRLMEIEIEGKTADDTEQFIAKLSQQQDLDRLLLSDGNLLAPLEKIFSQGGLYASVSDYITQFTGLFPNNPNEFFLEIRDLTTFIPEIATMLDEDDISNLLDGMTLADARWSDVVEDIRKAAPDSPITIWRAEDNPIVWPEVLRAVSGIGPHIEMQGDLDQAALALPDHATERLTAFIKARPELSLKQRRHVITSFLEAAKSDKAVAVVPEELAGIASSLSENYRTDVEKLRSIAGVTILE